MKTQVIRLALAALFLGTAVFATAPAPIAQAGERSPRDGPALANGPAGNMVVKNADLDLLVESTDTAVAHIARIATDAQGYVLTIQTWYEEGHKDATMTIGVPADSFETALQRVRETAIEVTGETGSGEDLTDQYTDLDSQLRNLQAEEARIRSFLDKTTTIEEALMVNQQLETLVKQMGEIQGQMQYLAGRAAVGVITIDIQEPLPTPTPTTTPTALPTSTPRPTPTRAPTPTPVVWLPGQTFTRASGTLALVAKTVWEGLIWVVIVALPIGVVVGIVMLGASRLARRLTGGSA